MSLAAFSLGRASSCSLRTDLMFSAMKLCFWALALHHYLIILRFQLSITLFSIVGGVYCGNVPTTRNCHCTSSVTIMMRP